MGRFKERVKRNKIRRFWRRVSTIRLILDIENREATSWIHRVKVKSEVISFLAFSNFVAYNNETKN